MFPPSLLTPPSPQALFDFTGNSKLELNFKVGDVIDLRLPQDSGGWRGRDSGCQRAGRGNPQHFQSNLVAAGNLPTHFPHMVLW